MFAHNIREGRTPFFFRVLLLILFSAITLFFSSCAAPTAYLTKNDIQAVQNIYEDSNWTFQQSLVNVSVNEEGAIKLSIAGTAIEKTPEGNNSIWIPVALLKELPEYYETNGGNSSKAKLMAYKVKGGLWSIAALIPETANLAQVEDSSIVENTSTESSLRIQKQPQTRPVNLEILMVSPVFAQSLPIILPIGQGVVATEASVELPPEAKFTSLWTRGDGESVNLTKLPSSISEGKVKALVKLQPEVAMVWDFSNVRYRLPGKPFLPIQEISLLCALVIFVWIGWEIWHRESRQYFERRKQRNKRKDQIERDKFVINLTESRIEQRSIVEAEANRWQPPTESEIEERAIVEAEAYRRRTFYWWNPLFIWQQPIKRFWFYTAVAILVVIILVLLISSIALSEEATEKLNESSDHSLLLSEFSLSVNSSDYNSDKVTATLSFLPLATKLEPNNMGQVAIEFGGNKVKLVEQSNKPDTVKVLLTTIDPASPQLKYRIENIPVKTVGDLELLTSASKRNVQIDRYDNIADIYNQAIEAEPKPAFIEMEYEIDDAITRKEQIPDKYFSWFPIDKASLEIPINIEGATTIISRIEVKAPIDLHAQVKQSGIEEMDSSLKRDETKSSRYLLKPGLNKFILINSGSKVTITGSYERNLPGKAFLTWGIAIIGGFVGLLVGFMSENWRALGQGIGVVLGSSLLALLAVVAVNKDFQSVISLRGQVSLFDVFLLLSLGSLVGTAILTRQSVEKLKSKSITSGTKKGFVIASLLYFGFSSFVIPILLAIFLHP